MECAASSMMAVGYILRVSWICLLLFGGSLPVPSMKGYKYTSTDHPEAMAEGIKLANYPTGMLDLYSLVKGYSDRSNKVPLAAALKQAPLNPQEAARFQGGAAMELGQENAEIEDWNHVGPVTCRLRPPCQHNSFEEQWGSRKPMFPSAHEPSTKPSSELAGSDLFPPTPNLFYVAFSSDPTLESKQVSTSGVYFNPTQNLNSQAGEREGSQIYADQPSSWSSASNMTGGEEPVFSNMAPAAPTISAQTLQADAVSRTDTKGGYSSSALYLDGQAGSQSYSPNLVHEDVFHDPAAETAQLPSDDGDVSDYNSVNADQPSTWSSAPHMTREEPVLSNWAQAAPNISAQILQAEAVPSTDTKGGDSSSSLHLDLPAGAQEGSQSYSTKVVYEDFPQYPAAETAQLPSPDDDPYTYDPVIAEQPSSWSSDRYITTEEPVFSSNAGDWAQAAPNISAQILEAEAVPSTDTKGGDSSSSLHLDLPAGVQEGSQSYSTKVVYEDFPQYPASETAQLPSEESDLSDYNPVNVVQPSTWSSAPYMTREEEPVYVSNSGDWAQAAQTISEQTLEAEAVPSTDTKGGYSSSALNLNFQAGVQEGSQSYSPNLVDEAVYQYPAAEAEQLYSEGVDASKYDSMYAVQPSTWSSASYMTREEEPVFSSHTGHWAHVAPVETPAYPSYVADFGLDSTSSKAAAPPVLFKPPKKAPQLPRSKWLQRPKKVRDQTASTYIVQSKGSYWRSRQMLSKKKYFSGFPSTGPIRAYGSETVRGKW
ncbi:unnamed protein product [Boreogadus saida]